jgi:hypothetical protein
VKEEVLLGMRIPSGRRGARERWKVSIGSLSEKSRELLCIMTCLYSQAMAKVNLRRIRLIPYCNSFSLKHAESVGRRCRTSKAVEESDTTRHRGQPTRIDATQAAKQRFQPRALLRYPTLSHC